MHAPLLSIVTPSLNAAATIEETLRSVRDSGLPADLVEHVVQDGGSTDGTLEILERAEGVSWVSEPDRGLSDAVNRGLARAGGSYVGWLNADDYYLPGSLHRVARALDRTPAPLWATAPCLIVDAEGKEIRRRVTAYKRFFLRRYTRTTLLAHNFIAAPATFARREALLAHGGFDERFRYSMDYDMWLRLSAYEPPVVLDEPVTAFRMAGETLSLTGFEEQFAEHVQNAREHGSGHPLAVTANAVSSRLIVLAYRALARRR